MYEFGGLHGFTSIAARNLYTAKVYGELVT